jgi:gliding motility-associated lipoprotein GldH
MKVNRSIKKLGGRIFLFFLSVGIIVTSCDSNRLYEDNVEFSDRTWKMKEPVQLEFMIQDTTIRYNLYMDVRNSIDYPFSRLFTNYRLADPTGAEVSGKMLSEFLFDQKTGEPFGQSAIGDVYDHQFIFLSDYSFSKPGKFKISFEQFMRQDSLKGILAIGLRVEKVEK